MIYNATSIIDRSYLLHMENMMRRMRGEMEQKGNKMTVQQLSMNDLLSVPLWECVKTCRNYGKHMGTFPTGEPRCEYGTYKDGTSGDDMYQEVDELGHVTIYCKYYRGDL